MVVGYKRVNNSVPFLNQQKQKETSRGHLAQLSASEKAQVEIIPDGAWVGMETGRYHVFCSKIFKHGEGCTDLSKVLSESSWPTYSVLISARCLTHERPAGTQLSNLLTLRKV